jgi:hypothetical protein
MPSRPPWGEVDALLTVAGQQVVGKASNVHLPPIYALCLYLSLEPDPLHLVLRETLPGLAVEFGGACVRNSYKFSSNMLG